MWRLDDGLSGVRRSRYRGSIAHYRNESVRRDKDETDEILDARGRIEEALDGLLDKETLAVLLTEVLAIKKQARGWCPNCKKAVQVDIPDSKAVVSAMGELLTQAKGRGVRVRRLKRTRAQPCTTTRSSGVNTATATT